VLGGVSVVLKLLKWETRLDDPVMLNVLKYWVFMKVRSGCAQVIVVDEIGTKAEAQAINTIGHRGTTVVGTAHGDTLEDVVKNPDLGCLLGGKSTVIMSDASARCGNWSDLKYK
jgi:stage III sporulation protein SpoIIIAA